MRRIFLDVGAHLGETLEVVQDPRWGFDRIHCFEPAPQCQPQLLETADHRTSVHAYGLWSSDCAMDLCAPGEVGASLFPSKVVGSDTLEVQLRDVAQWFAANLRPDDDVWMKLNCEGAEVEILDRLIDTGRISDINHLVVHFDIRKVPGKAHLETNVRRRLDATGVDYLPADAIFFGRNVQEKTRNWLAWARAGRIRRLRHSVLRRAEFGVRTFIYRVRQRGRARLGQHS